MEAKEILKDLSDILRTKRNEYTDLLNKYDPEDPYYNYCRGKKDMIEDIVAYLAGKFINKI